MSRFYDFINCTLAITLFIACIELVCIHSAYSAKSSPKGFAVAMTFGETDQKQEQHRPIITSDRHKTELAALSAACFAIRGCK
jgi:hypothetical protein